VAYAPLCRVSSYCNAASQERINALLGAYSIRPYAISSIPPTERTPVNSYKYACLVFVFSGIGHPRKTMQLIINDQKVIGYKVIIRLDRMIHRIIQGEIDDPTGLPGQAGQ
jgi:hypothetical protein